MTSLDPARGRSRRRWRVLAKHGLRDRVEAEVPAYESGLVRPGAG